MDLGHDDKPILPSTSASSRSLLFEELVTLIHTHTCVPTALGLGQSAMQDKAAALGFSLWLESGWEAFKTFLGSFAAFTTDMGPEKAIPTFVFSSETDMLPRWLRDSQMQSDVDEGDGTQMVNTSMLFPHAMPVLGLLHICSNAGRDIHRALPWWEVFHGHLKASLGFKTNPPFFPICIPEIYQAM